MGVYLQNNTSKLADRLGLASETGAVVAGVVPGSPAEKTGLQEGNAILQINNQKVNDAGDVTDYIEKSKVGDKLQPQIENSSGKNTLALTPSFSRGFNLLMTSGIISASLVGLPF